MRAYNVGMKRSRSQYTIRGVPEHVDRAVREFARKKDISVNQFALEALRRAAQVEPDGKEHFTDLDALIGSWKEDADFDAAVEGFAEIDEKAWK